MNYQSHERQTPRHAFTLIELLVVIAIIGILAAAIIPLAGIAAKKKRIAQATATIAFLDTAINQYKIKKGFYPPDNPINPAASALFYELHGMVITNTPATPTYVNTFYAQDTISTNTLFTFLGVGGVVNASADGGEIYNVIPTVNANQLRNLNTSNNPVWVFAIPTAGPNDVVVPSGLHINAVRYVSTNPTNNATTFDLWVDLLIGGETNRISNWSKDPQIVF
ncbi:MAG: hypothetical protein JWR26_4029 [Pedosphaera sp.]|nr:hypothetical protein [Pedosphaera sp.]